MRAKPAPISGCRSSVVSHCFLLLVPAPFHLHFVFPAPDMESGMHEAVAIASSNIFLSHSPVTFLARKGCFLSLLEQLNRVSRVPSFTFLLCLVLHFICFLRYAFYFTNSILNNILLKLQQVSVVLHQVF